ncbi:MAG: T9SS type A sorting domain-containing protein [Flavobacteriales bacterium]|nr:T9SS type A sorting domain-containing protein [Flavobacteriales bacterium]
MNRFSNIFLAAFLLLSSSPMHSVAQRLTCTTHEMTNNILANSPEKRALVEALDREAREYTETHYGERSGVIKVIPTVIHIIHNNGSENLTKQSVLNALEAVNEELRAQNSSTSSVASAFQGIVADVEFELRLAKIDDNGNCTDGITRTVSSQTVDAGEGVKDLINWNDGSRKYLQVWLVYSVAGGAGGYTYLPGSVGAHNNGIIIRAAQFQGSLAHEFGHWLNLSHTWGGTNEPAVASNCGDDDGVSDTPNTIGTSGGCNPNQTTCGSLDNVQNHMDYSACASMFTEGQKSRMQSAANSSTGGRNSYWSATNRTATGTADGFTNSCVPTVDFLLSSNQGCEGLQIVFEDNSWGADVDASWVWSWNFPGGNPSTSNDPQPVVTYPTAGTYDASLTISSAAGSNTRTISNAVSVTSLGNGIAGPFLEGMENSSFPNNADQSLVWTVESEGGTTWERSTAASTSGSASARINLRNISEGSIHSLISPPLDLSNVENADANMTFKFAHANRNSTTHLERLRVYVSKNCGESWSLRYSKDGDNLNTAGGLQSGIFTPDPSDWQEASISLATMAGEEHVLVKFEALSDRQSYLYIDDININPNATSSTGIAENDVFADVQIYPNPVFENSKLVLTLNESVDAELKLVNTLGQQLGVLNRKFQAGVNQIILTDLTYNLNSGVYFVQINTNAGSRTLRFVKE